MKLKNVGLDQYPHAVIPPPAFAQLGKFRIPRDYTSKHLAVLGTTGGGKTLHLDAFTRSIFTDPTYGEECNGIIFDIKGEALPKLAQMGLMHRVKLLMPLDNRSFRWNLAADITSVASAEALANILVPKDPTEHNPFFTQAVVTVLIGELKWYMRHAPGVWTFRDVLLVMRDVTLLNRMLGNDHYTKHHLNLLKNSETAGDIEATITNKLQRFEAIAACFEHAQETYSLTEWVNSNHIIVIGYDNTVAPSLEAMIQAFYNRAFQLVLRQPNSPHPRTFFIMDEVPSIPKIEMLRKGLTLGRAKGLSIALGLQSVAELRFIYEVQIADTILDQCNLKVLLRLNSPESAKYASDLVGEALLKETTDSRAVSSSSMVSDSHSQNQHYQKREAVLASEFLNIPITSPQEGMTGYYRIANKVAKVTMPWSEVEQVLLSGMSQEDADATVPGFVAAPDSNQWLEPFSAEDLSRLGINPSLPSSTSAEVNLQKPLSSLEQLGEELEHLRPTK